MKQRITALDLKILTSEIEKNILNYRLQNIYNVVNSNKHYTFKFSIPDSKKIVVVDSGFKIHMTDFERTTTQTPSGFVTKLRKHLKTRRLSNIRQLENDRVLIFEFSDGLFYLAFEFFSAGNILLLDHEGKIIALQRIVQDRDTQDKYAVGQIYHMFDKTIFDTEYKYQKKSYSVEEVTSWLEQERIKASTPSTDSGNKKNKKVYSIQKLLFIHSSHIPGDLIQRNLISKGIDPSSSCLEYASATENIVILAQALNDSEDQYIELIEFDGERAGYVVTKKNPLYNAEAEAAKDSTSDLEYLYDEFHPFEPTLKNQVDYKLVEISGYNKTVDSFFSTIESSKYALKIQQQEVSAQKRLEAARQEKDKKVQSLVDIQEQNIKKGEIIMIHSELVEAATTAIQTLLDQQMDWINIESLIKLEQSRGNVVAKLLKLPLNLKENKINLSLPDEIDEVDDDEDSESDSDSDSEGDDESEKDSSKTTKKNITVTIDLSLTSFANARTYFDAKKVAESKRSKVEKSAELALKNTERKINQDLAKNLKGETDVLKPLRSKYWFEKFYWFVSSEGYLILSGRDDSQNDMIYYRHFNDNDYFVSSDMDDSLKVFIKNPYKNQNVPPSTIFQAGVFALTGSKAWTNKIVASSWYLRGDEISKKDYDGSILNSGAFAYNGKKNYMPPAQLVMGFGFFWLGDEETAKSYRETRLSREAESGLEIADNKSRSAELAQVTESISREGSVPSEDENVKENDESHTPEPNNDEGVESSPVESEEDKYDLKNYEESSTVDSILEPEKQNATDFVSKKRLTAKERRDIKKGANSFDNNSKDVESIERALESLEVKEQVKEKSSQKPPNVRGKKGKMKKMATKYADQDDEERQLRMKALGTLKQVQSPPPESELNKSDTPETTRAFRNQQKQENVYRKYQEEGNDNESKTTNYLEILDSLIAKPKSTDAVYDCIPVFAPWYSLTKLKYKVKIQPGSAKKGKCLNDTMNYFANRKMDNSATDMDLDWENEHQILKATKNVELVSAFTVGKIKLVLPGGDAAAKKGSNGANKGGKKSGKK